MMEEAVVMRPASNLRPRKGRPGPVECQDGLTTSQRNMVAPAEEPPSVIRMIVACPIVIVHIYRRTQDIARRHEGVGAKFGVATTGTQWEQEVSQYEKNLPGGAEKFSHGLGLA